MSAELTSQANPHTTSAWITAGSVAAAAVASVHTASVDPAHLNVSVGATVAAISLFLFNLGRHHAFDERQP